MRVKAKEKFQRVIDVTIGRKRVIDEEWDVDEERGRFLQLHGYVDIIEEPKEEKEPKKRGRKKKEE